MCECIRSGTASGSGNVKPLLPRVGHHFAIVTPSLAGQGAERKALHIGNGLLERGHQVDILLERLVCHYAEEVPDRSRVYFMSERSDDRSRTNLRSAKFTARPSRSGACVVAGSVPTHGNGDAVVAEPIAVAESAADCLGGRQGLQRIWTGNSPRRFLQ